jgi:hypothetical protein
VAVTSAGSGAGIRRGPSGLPAIHLGRRVIVRISAFVLGMRSNV